jgi:hypothetical protein
MNKWLEKKEISFTPLHPEDGVDKFSPKSWYLPARPRGLRIQKNKTAFFY